MTDLHRGDYIEKGEQVLRIIGVHYRLNSLKEHMGEDDPYDNYYDMIDIQTYDLYQDVPLIEGYKKIDFSVEYLIEKSNKVLRRRMRELRDSRNNLANISKNFGQPSLF